MLAANAPGLARAVAECTQPSSLQQAGTDPVKNLQTYLSNKGSLDAVYVSLLNRACTEPHSANIILKVLDILKLCLLRYTPSRAVLERILNFCDSISGVVLLPAQGTQGVRYVRSCVLKRLSSDGSYSRTLPARLEDKDSSQQTQKDARASISHPPTVSSASAEVAAGLASLSHGAAPNELEILSPRLLLAPGKDLLIPTEDGSSPAWAVAPSSTLTRQGSSVLPPPWTAAVPHLWPHVAALQCENSHPAVSLSTLRQCVLDLDAGEATRHLLEIMESCKAEAHQSQPVPAAVQPPPPRRSRGRLMFHHPPYQHQEGLAMSEADVGVVVEVVCGLRAAGSLTGDSVGISLPGLEEGAWQAAYAQDGFGQVCGTILMKLVMDLWLQAGPGNSFPLVLRMLRRTLMSPQPEVRARAFDVVYNLSIHSSLLKTHEEQTTIDTPLQIPSPASPGLNPLNASASSDPVSSSIEPFTPVPAPQAPVPTHTPLAAREAAKTAPHHVLFSRWLRAVLFQLLLDLCEAEESHDSVWQAGLSALLHCTTHGGQWVADWVQHLPPAVLAGLLRAAVAFGWSQEVHCHLLSLARHLLQQPSTYSTSSSSSQSDTVPADDTQESPGNSSTRAFGGPEEALLHLRHAPTPCSRADAVAILACTVAASVTEGSQLISLLKMLGLECVGLVLQQVLVACQADAASGLAETFQEVLPSQVLTPSVRGALTRLLQHVERACARASADSSASSVSALIKVTVQHVRSGPPARTSSGMLNMADPGNVPVGDLPAETVLQAWQRFKELCSEPDTDSRQLAVHWLHRILSAACTARQGKLLSLSPLSLKTADSSRTPAAGKQSAPQWSVQLADALLHLVREVQLGCDLLLAAMTRVITDLRSENSTDASLAARSTITAHFITLLWILQCRNAADVLPAVLQLADSVLSALCTQPPPPLQNSASACYQSVASQIVHGQLAFDSDILAVTPPELLVSLLQQCSQPSIQHLSMQRGYTGRANPAAPLQSSLSSLSNQNSCTLTQNGSQHMQQLLQAPQQPVELQSSCNDLWREEPWQDPALDRCLALLLALIASCALDNECWSKYSLQQLVRGQLAAQDVRIRYYAGVYLLKHWQLNQPDKYWRTLRQLIAQAQQMNDERLLDNPYLQVTNMLNVDSDFAADTKGNR